MDSAGTKTSSDRSSALTEGFTPPGVGLTLQFAVQLLFLQLQAADPLLKRLHLLPAVDPVLLPDPQRRPPDGAAVREAAVGGEGEADEGEVLPREAGVRHRRCDVLKTTTTTTSTQTYSEIINGSVPSSAPHRVLQNVVVHIEVGGVGGGRHVGNVGGLQGSDVVPVNPVEERVVLEIRDPVQSEPAFPGAEQPLDQILGVF